MSQQDAERAQAEDFWKGVNDGLKARISELTEQLAAMDAELRERRAADLTAEDVEALEWFRDWATPQLDLPHDAPDLASDCEHCDKGRRALAVLTRLTRAGRKA